MPFQTKKDSKQNDKPEDSKFMKILSKPHLPTLWADNVILQVRGDDVCLIRILADLPEGMTEESRIMIQTGKLKEAIDYLCHTLQYFPQKKDKKPAQPAKKQ